MDLNKLSEYRTSIFDCDGVLLNSNKIKSEAFYETTFIYGVDYAQEFLKYHKENGGVSRFEKFNYFISNIIKEDITKEKQVDSLLKDFSKILDKNLRKAEVVPNLEIIRSKLPRQDWMVASGSKEDELRAILEYKGISSFFNKGIFGSPLSKIEIIQKKFEANELKKPIIFFGDSYYDYFCAKKFEIDFVFIWEWTEVTDWKNFCKENKIPFMKSISSIVL